MASLVMGAITANESTLTITDGTNETEPTPLKEDNAADGSEGKEIAPAEKEEEATDDNEKKAPPVGIAAGRPRRKASPCKPPASEAAPKASTKASTKAAPAKRKRAPAKKDGQKKAKKKAKVVDPSLPKVDGRSKNKGAAKRESYSVAFKAKMVRDFDAWEAEQKKNGNKIPSVREFVITKNLGHKYENFLSKSSGWRSPKMRQRILQDSISGYQHMARMPDRSKNKSYYADMEAALLVRLDEYRAKNLTITTKTIRDLAREELRRLTNNDEEKVNAFKASNGWIYNFLKRQERRAKTESMKKKMEKKMQSKEKQDGEQKEEDAGMHLAGIGMTDMEAKEERDKAQKRLQSKEKQDGEQMEEDTGMNLEGKGMEAKEAGEENGEQGNVAGGELNATQGQFLDAAAEDPLRVSERALRPSRGPADAVFVPVPRNGL